MVAACLASIAGGRSGRCCLGQPVLKEALFGLGLREVERAAVRAVGLIVPAGATQEVGTRGVEVPVVVEVETVEDGQAGLGPVDLGDGDGPVHLDDRRAGLLGERLVQGGDLPPVAGLMQVPVKGRCRVKYQTNSVAVDGQQPPDRFSPGGGVRPALGRSSLLQIRPKWAAGRWRSR